MYDLYGAGEADFELQVVHPDCGHDFPDDIYTDLSGLTRVIAEDLIQTCQKRAYANPTDGPKAFG